MKTHVEIRSEQAGLIKEGNRVILISEDIKKMTNKALQLVSTLEKQQLFFQTSGRDSTRVHEETHYRRN